MSAIVQCMTCEQFTDRIKAGEKLPLIDVRTEIEFAEVHASPARNIPLDKMNDQLLQAAGVNKEQPVAFICKSGVRAAKACERLASAGFNTVYNIVGGTDAWTQAGMDVQQRKVLPLMRQVQIVAGCMVLIGVILGFSVHRGFFGVSAFVGCGLMFAGVTGWCGMAMLLAKMPWNTSLGKSASCSTSK